MTIEEAIEYLDRIIPALSNAWNKRRTSMYTTTIPVLFHVIAYAMLGAFIGVLAKSMTTSLARKAETLVKTTNPSWSLLRGVLIDIVLAIVVTIAEMVIIAHATRLFVDALLAL